MTLCESPTYIEAYYLHRHNNHTMPCPIYQLLFHLVYLHLHLLHTSLKGFDVPLSFHVVELVIFHIILTYWASNVSITSNSLKSLFPL